MNAERRNLACSAPCNFCTEPGGPCFSVRVLVGVTYLHQTDPDDLRPPESDDLGSRLIQQIRPSAALARFLYRRIGRPYGWSSRLHWSDGEWTELLARPDHEFWVSWQHGQLTGFAELWLGRSLDRTVTYIKFLGLLPEHCGLGLGGHLVAQVTRRAWTAHQRTPALPHVEEVTVDTSSLDDDRALPNYLARGFRVVGEKAVERDVTGSVRSAGRAEAADPDRSDAPNPEPCRSRTVTSGEAGTEPGTASD